MRPKENGIAIVTALDTNRKHTAPGIKNKKHQLIMEEVI